MAVAAACDLPKTNRAVFVLRRDLPHLDEIRDDLVAAFPDARIVVLDRLTSGQAVTCLAALGEVDPAQLLTIGACDTGLVYDADRIEALMADATVDVVVWCFRGHAAARRRPRSYDWIDAVGGKVDGVAVKEPLCDPPPIRLWSAFAVAVIAIVLVGLADGLWRMPALAFRPRTWTSAAAVGVVCAVSLSLLITLVLASQLALGPTRHIFIYLPFVLVPSVYGMRLIVIRLTCTLGADVFLGTQ